MFFYPLDYENPLKDINFNLEVVISIKFEKCFLKTVSLHLKICSFQIFVDASVEGSNCNDFEQAFVKTYLHCKNNPKALHKSYT